MSDEELIARLRDEQPVTQDFQHTLKCALMDAAADRIEALTANLTKAVEALQWCSGSADFNEGGVAREGWLKVCAPLLKGDSHD